MESDHSMKQWKKNLLVRVITRIDYEDQIEILPETYLKLKEMCIQHNIDQIDNRTLEPEQDFATYDSIPFRDLPEGYIKKITCKVFYNREFKLEVNPLFLRVIQSPTADYKNYETNHLNLVTSTFNILGIPDTQIQRISIRKCDEAFYEDINVMTQCFKKEIIQNDIFGHNQNWNIPQAESKIIQNFTFKDFRVNFFRYIDRGTVLEKKHTIPESYIEKILYRLFLDYEVCTGNNITHYNDVLLEINEITESLFWETFNEHGKKILETEGGSFNNYVLSQD